MNNHTIATAVAGSQWRAYLRLCKPKVVVLVVFTAIVAMIRHADRAPTGARLEASRWHAQVTS